MDFYGMFASTRSIDDSLPRRDVWFYESPLGLDFSMRLPLLGLQHHLLCQFKRIVYHIVKIIVCKL